MMPPALPGFGELQSFNLSAKQRNAKRVVVSYRSTKKSESEKTLEFHDHVPNTPFHDKV